MKAKLRFPDKIIIFCMSIETSQELKENVWSTYNEFIKYINLKTKEYKKKNPEATFFFMKLKSRIKHSQFKNVGIMIKIGEKKNEKINLL